MLLLFSPLLRGSWSVCWGQEVVLGWYLVHVVQTSGQAIKLFSLMYLPLTPQRGWFVFFSPQQNSSPNQAFSCAETVCQFYQSSQPSWSANASWGSEHRSDALSAKWDVHVNARKSKAISRSDPIIRVDLMICSALKPGEAVRRRDVSPSGCRADGED